MQPNPIPQGSYKTHQHVLRALNGLEAHKWYLHGEYCADAVERAVGYVDAMREAARYHQGQDVQWYQIDKEYVTTPWGYHVEVGQGWAGRPENGAWLDRLDPQVVGEEHAEDCNALIVVGTGNRAWYVAGHNGDQCCSDQTSASALQGEQDKNIIEHVLQIRP